MGRALANPAVHLTGLRPAGDLYVRRRSGKVESMRFMSTVAVNAGNSAVVRYREQRHGQLGPSAKGRFGSASPQRSARAARPSAVSARAEGCGHSSMQEHNVPARGAVVVMVGASPRLTIHSSRRLTARLNSNVRRRSQGHCKCGNRQSSAQCVQCLPFKAGEGRPSFGGRRTVGSA